MKGKLQLETLSSVALKGNPLGDSHRRELPVYLPPSYGSKRSKRYGVLYYLPGFTGGGRSVVNYNPWRENLVERLDRLIAEGKARECVLVVVDGFTRYGGSQYVNSSATGRYEDHVVSEVVPFIEDKLFAGGGRDSRAIFGKSSGGFGALTLAMRHPDLFAHMACHSGDMFFEGCYAPDILKFCAALQRHGGSAAKFREAFLAAPRKEGFDHAAINLLAMAACYSPNPKSPLGFDLPCEEATARLRPEVWRRWKAFDPVEAAPRHRAALKSLKTLYFDCGRRDECFLQFGARQLAETLKRLKVRHVYEEHDFGHFDMDDRYDRSLTLLSAATAS